MTGKRTGNPVGRPTVMTPEVLDKLQSAFAIGCTDTEACIFADIDMSSMYKYQEKHPEFTERKHLLKKKPVLKARMNLMDSLNQKNIDTSKWFLERKARDEFATRTVSDNFNVEVELTEEKKKEINDMIERIL
jgi:hypothetical protein